MSANKLKARSKNKLKYIFFCCCHNNISYSHVRTHTHTKTINTHINNWSVIVYSLSFEFVIKCVFCLYLFLFFLSNFLIFISPHLLLIRHTCTTHSNILVSIPQLANICVDTNALSKEIKISHVLSVTTTTKVTMHTSVFMFACSFREIWFCSPYTNTRLVSSALLDKKECM